MSLKSIKFENSQINIKKLKFFSKNSINFTMLLKNFHDLQV